MHRDWAKQTFGLAPGSSDLDAVVGLMEQSWGVYENYTSPLGLGFVVSGGYGGGPCMGEAAYEQQKPDCRPAPCHDAEDDSCPPRGPAYLKQHGSHYWMDPCSNWGYSNYTQLAVGCDRTSAGSGYAAQYPAAWTKLYDDPATCPQELLLFFHNLPWGHRLKSGLTISEHFDASHHAGLAAARRLRAVWGNLTAVDAEVHEAVSRRFELQISDAQFFSDVLLAFWHSCAPGGAGGPHCGGS